MKGFYFVTTSFLQFYTRISQWPPHSSTFFPIIYDIGQGISAAKICALLTFPYALPNQNRYISHRVLHPNNIMPLL